MPSIKYRELTEIDALAVSELRHSVLESDPDTFSISIDEENRGSIETLKEVLTSYQNSIDRTIFGAFDNALVGMIGVERFHGDYTKHKARVWGLCVNQSHRKKGIANALITRSIMFAENLNGVEKMTLEVTDAATVALRLYNSFGFSMVGRETNALKVGHRYIGYHRLELRLQSGSDAD